MSLNVNAYSFPARGHAVLGTNPLPSVKSKSMCEVLLHILTTPPPRSLNMAPPRDGTCAMLIVNAVAKVTMYANTVTTVHTRSLVIEYAYPCCNDDPSMYV